MQNAAARLIYNLRRCDHISDALISLHWLCVPQRITFSVGLRSEVVPPPAVTAAKVWNSLPSDVTSAPLLPVFRNRQKHIYFTAVITLSDHYNTSTELTSCFPVNSGAIVFSDVRYMLSPVRLSACRLSVCNARAPYSGG